MNEIHTKQDAVGDGRLRSRAATWQIQPNVAVQRPTGAITYSQLTAHAPICPITSLENMT